MTSLDTVIKRVTEGYNTSFIIASVIAFAMTVASGNVIAMLFLTPILVACYFVGLWLLGFLLGFVINPVVLRAELQAKRIQILNEKLDKGELIAGTQELEDAMNEAGLKPLSVIINKGPVFGRQFGIDLHEWIDARQGLNGDVHRYNYVGQAQFGPDGSLLLKAVDAKHLYLVLDGVLYECALE